MVNDFLKMRRLLLTLILSCVLLPAFACVKLSRNLRNSSSQASQRQPERQTQTTTQPARLNLNTATTEELEKLPGIGKVLAARIVAHREQYGGFRRAEHLIMVRGLSERRFREIRDLISVE